MLQEFVSLRSGEHQALDTVWSQLGAVAVDVATLATEWRD